MSGLAFEAAFDLRGQVVIITGAAGGIGQSLAAAFAERGARLMLIDRAESVYDVAARYPGARGFVADITSEHDVDGVVAAIAEAAGRIDVLVNNAAIGHVGPAEAVPEAEWTRVIDINLNAQYRITRAVAPHMLARGYGRVVFMASQAAVVGLDQHVAYCASKTGLLGMARCMAIEWGSRGVTVNCVSPTVVNSPMALVGWSGEKGERARAEIPTRRFAEPEEVALAIVFLASGAAAMINGVNLPVDGGYTIR
ncbi:D-threitol dehydrogenase [Acetobacteraceae bacterium KSS8]|uniref:D-threitol dehydrogenase n=1 Tax=Endosaccharibacter trunci TaxID=2812733 RepID=A0ABT1WB32_9PROT|nr:D-threitol dehydrogenase [Acetobacteraceae bacterium KSS8]